MIRDNLSGINGRIRAACERVGRNRNEVNLILVSKTVSADRIREAYDLGVRDFGENRVQEWLDKKDVLPKDIRWHLIGHLQTNKVKFCDSGIELIHSLDSERLARELNQRAMQNGVRRDCLIQVNAFEETSKFGIAPEELDSLARMIDQQYPHIAIRGLMTIGPLTENIVKIRDSFKLLKSLQMKMKEKIKKHDWKYLSMGMSFDFEIAIEEGANLIRLGTAIFGERTR